MHIIVTGASSFLGRAACEKLKEHGHRVTAFRHSFNEEPPELVPMNADVWLHFAWAGVGSAGRSDPMIQQYNLDMSVDAVAKATEIGCRKFIFAGSQAEYGHAQDGSLKSEDGPVDPVSEYGRAKQMFGRLAENFVDRYNSSEECRRPMRYVHLRLFSVYGPGDHEGSLVNSVIRKLQAGETVELGKCAQQWNYLYIDDAAEAIALMCEKFTGGIYNIGSSDIRPLRSYVEELASILEENAGSSKDLKSQLRFGVRPDNAEGPADLSPDITKLTLMGFEPKVSFAEGIRRMLESEES
ncbi:MAG: NAD(P)-dependent oxidoreductase [Lachnospiraceae bacterium]|nr:NAD(P)-dependent oxidoreductase [Lachnospiraceae bacterium]